MRIPTLSVSTAGTLPRRLPAIYSKTARDYAKQIGTILWAWNRLHGRLAGMFVSLISPRNMRLGLGIWHAVKADSAQRDMLRAAIGQSPAIPEKLSEAIEWLLDLVDKLSQHRNDVAHVPMTVGINGEWKNMVPLPDDYYADPARTARLSRKDLRVFHKKLLGDLLALTSYAEHVAERLTLWSLKGSTRGLSPLPRRPKLQAIPPSAVPLTRSQKGRQQKKEAQKRQLKSSRGKPKRDQSGAA